MDAHDYISYVERVGARVALEERLAAIEASDLNAFSEVFTEEARSRADALDTLPVSERGRLHGLVVAVKDEVPVAGYVTGYGTRAVTRPATESAHVVQRLEAEGALIVGHTRMPEFGAWPVTESAHAGATLNPHHPEFSPGGSSGGTATAVAAGLVPVGIGGDGGGSIRIPSAHCGLVGLKARRGAVSTYPHPHLWWSLGVVGPLTRSVRDAALIYDVIAGNRDTDLYRGSFEGALSPVTAPPSVRFMVVDRGLSRVDPLIGEAVHRCADRLSVLGHRRVAGPRTLPVPTPAFLPQFFAGIRAEIPLVDDASQLERRTVGTARWGAWATDGVRRWAERQGEHLARRVDRLFDEADVVLTPTVAARPPRAGVFPRRALGAVMASLPYVAFTALWNVTGHPAISVPVGMGEDGLPVAVQLVARDERLLLGCAEQVAVFPH